MPNLLKKFFKKKKPAKKTANKPALVLELRDREWQGEGVRQLRYQSYEEYLEHQRLKLGQLTGNDRFMAKMTEFKEALRERVKASSFIRPGSSVLCIAARLGTECQAFIEAGHFAVGIDLEPGTGNQYVVVGDFHNLQYADNTLDLVYTNSLDHAFQLDKIFAEVKRVLKPGGIFMAEIVKGSKEEGGRDFGDYEATWWDTHEEVVTQIEKAGFTIEYKEDFVTPWAGVMTICRK